MALYSSRKASNYIPCFQFCVFRILSYFSNFLICISPNCIYISCFLTYVSCYCIYVSCYCNCISRICICISCFLTYVSCVMFHVSYNTNYPNRTMSSTFANPCKSTLQPKFAKELAILQTLRLN